MEVFEAALTLPPEARHAFLDTTCAGDPGVRAEVLALLAADEAAGGQFLRSPMPAPTSEASAASDYEIIGRRVGRYTIQRLIGSGGMGAVYEATQEEPRRTVALKVVKSGFATRSALRRFAHEAQILAQLRHPNIAQVYDAGTHRDRSESVPYFAMELVPDARPLTVFAHETRLPTRRRLEIFLRVCDAVRHGHQRGIIHRDLKPGNILVDEAGEPKVIDFGVALATDIDQRVTTVQTDIAAFVGTLRYMSPEQCSGDPRGLDTRSDIYALGVVLYELLTGQLPYDLSGSSAYEIPRIIREAAPRRLSSIDRALRGDLETIVLKALDKERERRYQAVGEFAQDIRHYLANEPIQARRATNWYVLRKSIARHKVGAAAIAVIALLTAASALSLGVLYRQAEDRARALREADYFNRIALALNAYEQENTPNVVELLAGCPEDLRGWEWYYLQRLSDTAVMTLRDYDRDVSAVCYSPDGAVIAAGDRGSVVRLHEAAGGRILETLVGHQTYVTSLDFAPDGRSLVAGGVDGAFYLWDLNAPGPARVVKGHGFTVIAEMSPDGTTLMSASSDGLIKLWDVQTLELVRTLGGDTAPHNYAAFSPDGRRIASALRDSTVRIWDAATGAEIRVLHGHRDRVRTVAYDHDGTRLVSTSWDNTVRVWNAESGDPIQTIDDKTSRIAIARFSPDGDHVVGATHAALKMWEIASGNPTGVHIGHDERIMDLAFSPDSRHVITGSADRTLRMWELEPLRNANVLRNFKARVHALSISPDGTRIAIGGQRPGVHVVDAETGDDLLVLDGARSYVNRTAFDPSGARIAGGSGAGVVWVWDARSGAVLLEIPAHQYEVDDLAYSPDGSRMLSVGLRSEASVWDARTGASLLRITDDPGGCTGAAFAPDGQRLVTTGRQSVAIRDALSGRTLLAWKTEQPAGHPAWSPDGRWIAVCTGSKLQLFDAVTGRLVHDMRQHLRAVLDVVFSPDGRRLVSMGYGNLIKMWDTRTGRLTLTLDVHVGPAPAVAFSSDGRYFVTGSEDMTVRKWDAGRAFPPIE